MEWRNPISSWVMYQSNRSFNPPKTSLQAYPRHLTPLPSRGAGNLIITVFQGMGNLNHSLDFMWNLWALCMWPAIMVDEVLEDFRGKDCAFVANWLRGKGLNKLCAIFEGIKLCFIQWNTNLYRWFNTTIKSSKEVNYFDLPEVCLLGRWVMMHVSEMVMNIACMECSNLSRWDFFYRTLCMLHDTQRKAEHSVTL